MEIEFDLNKSVEENAGNYFDLAKKAKKKLEGASKALETSKKELEKLKKQEEKFYLEEEKKKSKQEKKREWYEKFHWFISSDGLLCIGGKDATSNELVIKKQMEKDDLVFHTEAPGSPFFLIKGGINAPEQSKEEAAVATAAYSKSWKSGHTSAEVFSILPEQVTKEAKSGEYISKGSFMIYGKKTFYKPKMEYAIGLVEEEVIGGPESAMRKKTSNYIIVVPGGEKKSALAKKIRSKLKGGELDEIIKFLPGEAEIKK